MTRIVNQGTATGGAVSVPPSAASRVGAAQCETTESQHMRQYILHINVSVYPTLLCREVDARNKGLPPFQVGRERPRAFSPRQTQIDPATFLLANSKELPAR